MRKIFCVIMLVPMLAYGEPCTRASVVTAPCGGVLLPTQAAQQGLRCLEVGLPECALKAEKAAGICEADKKLLAANLSASQTETTALAKALREATVPCPAPKQPGWYENQWMWFSVGLVVGGGTVLYLTK